MSYLTQNSIASSSGMFWRVAQAAAEEGITEPDNWTQENRRFWAAAPGWDEAWESYLVSNPDATDPGLDEAVITDAQILSQVQAMNGAS